jgi:hypothetical protein
MNYTISTTTDGFGAQYQKIIQTYIYCKLHNKNFLYKPFSKVEHNYDNDINYIDNIENLINLKNNITNIDDKNYATEINYLDISNYLEGNIDLCCDSHHMKFIKDCFWSNKNKIFFNNGMLNVSIHIRRENCVDNGLAGERVTTPNSYYLKLINYIANKYKDRNIMFHVYSQGHINNFREFSNYNNVKLYLNYDVFETFKALVAADILVISPSSFSYVAALISDGEVYYKKFWHNPRKNWIII